MGRNTYTPSFIIFSLFVEEYLAGFVGNIKKEAREMIKIDCINSYFY
jgi:hypothetical protein